MTASFPRLTSRGPIEATIRPPSAWRPAFPRLTSRGPIEARRTMRRGALAPRFPRLTSRGPIEA